MAASACSGDLLCERLEERASIVLAQALLQLSAAELAFRLDHGALAVDPFGLDRVQPRTFARQAADQQATAAARGLDAAVVLLEPGTHLLADVPGGVVPDQRQHLHALGRELPGRPGAKGAGH